MYAEGVYDKDTAVDEYSLQDLNGNEGIKDEGDCEYICLLHAGQAHLGKHCGG